MLAVDLRIKCSIVVSDHVNLIWKEDDCVGYVEMLRNMMICSRSFISKLRNSVGKRERAVFNPVSAINLIWC